MFRVITVDQEREMRSHVVFRLKPASRQLNMGKFSLRQKCVCDTVLGWEGTRSFKPFCASVFLGLHVFQCKCLVLHRPLIFCDLYFCHLSFPCLSFFLFLKVKSFKICGIFSVRTVLQLQF